LQKEVDFAIKDNIWHIIINDRVYKILTNSYASDITNGKYKHYIKTCKYAFTKYKDYIARIDELKHFGFVIKG